MTISLKHLVTATGTDAGNGQIGKAQWNDEHTLAMASQKLLGRASSGAGSVEEIDLTAAGRALLDDADASEQRSTLGLGSIATQSANGVSITGGSITGITDLAIADGGTGASDPSGARSNLGLGSLATLSSVGTTEITNSAVTYAKMQNVSATDRLLGRSTAGAGVVEEIVCTAAGRALLDDASATAQIATLGLSASGGSNNIGFLQNGTGAVARTVQSKARDVVSVLDFGADPTGASDSSTAIQTANSSAVATGSVLAFPSGTYRIDTSTSFTAPVVMQGGVITGSGTVSFLNGFEAPLYYCFDCLVGKIWCDAVYAEWFGARHSTDTPTSTGGNISAKAWNSWPYFINGANFGTRQNYGNSAFLAANKPFSNADTWDFIAIQRALWSFGEAIAGFYGKVQLMGAAYYLSRAVRYVSDMTVSLVGEGTLQTTFRFANLATHEVQTFAAGNVKCLLTFYSCGPTPINIFNFGMVGPSGYDPGDPSTIFICAMSKTNGVTFHNVWFSTGYALFYMDDSCSDIWISLCKFEFGLYHVFGWDALSWVQIANTGFWKGGYAETGVTVAGYAFITGCLFVSMNNPYTLGLGSHVASTTIIQATTGYRTIVDGRTITRRLGIPAGSTVTVATISMGAYNALTTDMVAGGALQGVGGVGFSNKLSWYTDGSAPVSSIVSAVSKWGDVTAQTLVAPNTTTGVSYDFSIQVANTGVGAEKYDCDVTLTIEGGDFVISGLI